MTVPTKNRRWSHCVPMLRYGSQYVGALRPPFGLEPPGHPK